MGAEVDDGKAGAEVWLAFRVTDPSDTSCRQKCLMWANEFYANHVEIVLQRQRCTGDDDCVMIDAPGHWDVDNTPQQKLTHRLAFTAMMPEAERNRNDKGGWCGYWDFAKRLACICCCGAPPLADGDTPAPGGVICRLDKTFLAEGVWEYVRIPTTVGQFRTIRQFCEAQRGRGYSPAGDLQMLAWALPCIAKNVTYEQAMDDVWLEESFHTTGFSCSEFVAIALMRAGLLPEEVDPCAVSPQQLYDYAKHWGENDGAVCDMDKMWTSATFGEINNRWV
jgi:hypothetical protein